MFQDEQNNRVRKVFEIREDEDKIPFEWFSDNMMSASSFPTWKKTLKDVKTLTSIV